MRIKEYFICELPFYCLLFVILYIGYFHCCMFCVCESFNTEAILTYTLLYNQFHRLLRQSDSRESKNIIHLFCPYRSFTHSAWLLVYYVTHKIFNTSLHTVLL